MLCLFKYLAYISIQSWGCFMNKDTNIASHLITIQVPRGAKANFAPQDRLQVPPCLACHFNARKYTLSSSGANLGTKTLGQPVSIGAKAHFAPPGCLPPPPARP